MILKDKLAGEVEDPLIAEALRNFKSSVDAWSDAAYCRPRAAITTARHTWRLAATVAMGCVLVAGSVTAVVDRHHKQELARQATIKAAAQKAASENANAAQPVDAKAPVAIAASQPGEPGVQADAGARPAAAGAAEEDSDLMAKVDRDVSREVPAAMDPLAQLINGNGSN
jgi:hypothetical protein